MLFDDTDNKSSNRTAEAIQTKRRHGHLNDLGLGSLIAYFFCLSAYAALCSNGSPEGVFDDSILFSFLIFTGAVSLTLLFLGMVEPYMLRHDNHKRFASVSGVFLALGPAFSAIENITSTTNSVLVIFLFALSGCGYAICLLVWGRVLSLKGPDRTSRQILADTSAAIIVMAIVPFLPEFASLIAITCLGLIAGLAGSLKAVSVDVEKSHKTQVVVSDTRNVIPRSAYFAAGTLWVALGIFFALLNDVSVFNDYLNIAALVVAVIAAVAGLAIVRLHRNPNMNLSKISWVSVPFLVTALVIFVAGDSDLLSLAVVLVVFAMIISYLHLMIHFSALAYRPDLLSDQMFAWGWLAPFGGMSAGIFAGVVFRVVEGPAVGLFLSIVAGILVLAMIVSMLNIEKIALHRQKREADRQSDVAALASYETQMSEALADLGLSLREKEVALLILQGRSQAVIASQLFVAESTVNTHVKHIYRKANVFSKQEFIGLCHSRLQENSGGFTSAKSKKLRTR